MIGKSVEVSKQLNNFAKITTKFNNYENKTK